MNKKKTVTYKSYTIKAVKDPFFKKKKKKKKGKSATPLFVIRYIDTLEDILALIIKDYY